MERLQKKCMLGSLMTHCALVGVLSLAAFTSQPTFKPLTISETPPNLPFEMIKVTDGDTVIGGGGGRPPAAPQKKQEEPVPAPPQVAPAPVQAAPEPVPVPPPAKAEKVVEPPRAEKPVNTAVVNEFKPVDKPKKQTKSKPADKPKDKDDEKSTAKNDTKKPETKKVAVNLNATVRSNDVDVKRQQQLAQARQEREAVAAAQRATAARQAVFANIGKNVDRLGSSLSDGGVSIDLPPGPGYGQTFMNYAQYVKEIYDRSWIVPDSVVANEGVVRVEIVVQRNGTARGRVLKSSGNATLDRSVQNALNSVSNIGHPFPEGSTDNTRTFIINFNLSSKRQAG
jgi:TonB family protein